ncbi:hypothetical protein A2U01_0110873, partial [Trifolium medium]|nr:hypothetical protein [Trifolium medium]
MASQAEDMASQVEAVVDARQTLFDEIPNEVIATIPKINYGDLPKKNKDVKDKALKDNA